MQDSEIVLPVRNLRTECSANRILQQAKREHGAVGRKDRTGMKKELSAGIVVYRRDEKTGKLYYLLLHYLGGHWDLPKGKIEANESPEDAAIREVREETGLTVQPYKGFSEVITYYYRGPERELVDKSVVFFIGSTTEEKVQLSPEHLAYAWLEINPALNRLTYNNARHLLSMVNQFIHALIEAEQAKIN